MIYVTYPSHNRRQAYRIRPDAATPIQLHVANTPVVVVDISANGISFRLDTPLAGLFADPRQELPALLLLGQAHHALPITLALVGEHGGEYRCCISHYNTAGQKLLSRFIVKHQKKHIRAVHTDGQLTQMEPEAPGDDSDQINPQGL